MADATWGGSPGSNAAAPAAEDLSLVPQWQVSTAETRVRFDGFVATFPPPTSRVYGQINSAVRMESGDLLFNVLPDNICYHFSQRTKAFTYVFELHWGPGTFLWSCRPGPDGNIYATMSGMRMAPPLTDADFGNWGAVVAVNPRKHAMRTLGERGLIVDPYSVQVLPDGRLVIADFGGFGKTGKVYTLDPINGHVRVLAEGDYFMDPTSAFLDDDGMLWVANGDQDKQDGAVLRIDPRLSSDDPAHRTEIHGREGAMSGALLGVYPSHDPGFVIATKNEWANRTRTKVMLVDKTGVAAPETLLSASEDAPKFYSTIGSVSGSKLYVAECCDRELLEYDLVERKISATYDLTAIMGGHRGMRNSFDSVSAVYVVP